MPDLPHRASIHAGLRGFAGPTLYGRPLGSNHRTPICGDRREYPRVDQALRPNADPAIDLDLPWERPLFDALVQSCLFDSAPLKHLRQPQEAFFITTCFHDSYKFGLQRTKFKLWNTSLPAE